MSIGSPQSGRYTDLSFPSYRHRPGQTPHPRRDPQGHMYGREELPCSPFDPSSWKTCPEYLFGVDLYNFAYYWEAHEVWEGLWKTTEKGGDAHRFLQGLIQMAAALIKREQKTVRGMRSLARAGLGKLRSVSASRLTYCGVFLPEYIERMEAILDPRREESLEPSICLDRL